jgi:hypothetical protein
LEDDALHALFPAQFFDIDAGEFGHVRFAVDDGSEIGDGWGFVGVKRQRLGFGKIKCEFRAVLVVDANDVGPRDFEFLAFGKRLNS